MCVCRLEAYDRNHNFSNVVEVVETNADPWPEGLSFRQLTNSHRALMPQVSTDMINLYLADVPTMSGMVKSIERGTKLVESGRVVGCSFAATDTSFYFTGIVRAAMKKKVCVVQ